MALLISIFFGIVPMLLFAWFVYWMDRFEKEPKLLLGGVFLWGGLVAAGAAYLLNTVLGVGVYLFTSSQTATDLATGSLIAPMVEELLKGAAVMLVFLIVHHEFDTILDGIVYSAIVALGFAAAENTLYIYRDGYGAYGWEGLFAMVFIRVGLVGWQHPFYTSFTGIGLAAARLNHNTMIKVLAPFTGLLLAIFTHSLHNTFAVALQGIGGFVLGTIFDWSGWVFMFMFVLWALYREQKWISRHLREEVTLGVITAGQYRTACSTLQQSIVRFGALMNGRFRVTSRFYQVCAELAFKKHQYQTMGEESGNSPAIDRLRTELSSLSPQAFS